MANDVEQATPYLVRFQVMIHCDSEHFLGQCALCDPLNDHFRLYSLPLDQEEELTCFSDGEP